MLLFSIFHKLFFLVFRMSHEKQVYGSTYKSSGNKVDGNTWRTGYSIIESLKRGVFILLFFYFFFFF